MIGNSIDIEPIADNHHRWNFISKIPFFHKSKKPPLRRLKLLEIYRFADKFDVLLMIIGIAAAILSGVLFPIMLFFYGKIINNLVDTKKMHIAVNSSSFIINNDTDQCFILPDSNNTQNESPYNIINQTLHYYAILGCLSIVFYWIAWTTWLLAAERQVRRIRYALFQNILQQEMGWFDVNNIGLLNNRLLTDLNIIKDGIDDKIPDLFSLLTRILGSIIYVFIVGWKLTLLFLCLLPLMLILFKLIIKITVIYANKGIEAFALASSVAQEVFQNIRTVTAFHGQIKEEERFTKHLILSKNLEIKKNLYLGLCQGLAYFLVFISYGLTLWYGPKLVRTDCNNYSAGSVMVIFIGCMFSTVNLAYLTPNIQKIFEALTSGSYVFEIIDRKTKIDPLNNDGDKPENFIGEIEFDNVSFSYPSRPEISIFNRISLKIPANKIVALVGHSGCGKSTIIQLIQRLYDSEQGQILIDGKDIKTLNVAWLRSQIGIVSQEPNLFLGSIEDNIRFGKLNATDDEIETAAKIANAHQFIMELPQHYKSESVNKLSGGQKQRVAIARALISNPKILILDEATSALDNISERLIQEELEKNKQGRTTIIIAHRLSTIENADLIIGFDNGQVIEYGTHDQLIQSKGLYYKLITSQNEKEKSSINNEENNQMEELIPRNSIQTEITNENQILDENLQTNFDKYSKLNHIHDSISLVWKMFKLNSPEWSWIVLGGISSLFLGATQPLFAVFLGKIFALFSESDLDEQKRLINLYSTMIILIGLIGGIASIFISISFAKSSEQLMMRMRKLIFSSILRQEISYFDLETNSPGALITRLSTDASCLKGMTGNNIGIILQTLSATITALVITFAAGWKLTFVALCFVPLIIYSGVLQGRKQNNIDKTINKDSFDEQGGQYATQALENIRTIASLHLENYFLDVYKNSFDQQFKKRSFRLCLPGISAAITNSLVYFLYMAIFSYGSQLVQQEEMSFDQVLRILIGITFTMTTVGRSIAMLSDYSKARQAARRIFQLHQRQSKINPHNQSGLILDTVLGSIQFDNVQFEYPSRSNLSVLNNFSLNCSNSSTTALVGPSGSGKSTIIGLLQRFYDPSQGKIYLDGYDIKHLNLQWLRSLMGFVQQEPVLFNLSIRENIAYGSNDQQVTQDQIEHAAKLAHIHHFIISLPKGYETLCGSKGNQLSGGQKQRIAIARALIRQPKILLLDEATSSLDNHSEELVQQALNEAMVGRTSLTVAHRLSTIQHSDKIAFVYQGKIQEEGKHEQLIKLNGFYAQLLFKQEK